MKVEGIEVTLIKKSTVTFPKVSVIIRCKNESKHIEKCILAILNQDIGIDVEIVVIDSGSTDETLDIVKKYDVSLYTIPSKQFQFGSSMNLGVALSNGEYCTFVSAHAIPANNKWLVNLVNPMLVDMTVAGTFSRQLYYPEADFIQKRTIDETFGQDKKIYKVTSGTFKDNLKKIKFSNASSCIKKEVAKKIKFANLIASEDREWAYRVMKEGYKIEYVPSSLIYHSHNETPEQWYHRIYINSRALNEFAGVKINFFELVPLACLKVIKDVNYCRSKKINLSLKNIKKSFKYEWLYSLAHLKGSK